MFWKKKPKLPVTPEDQLWVEESLTFLKECFGKEYLLGISTVEPISTFFDRKFDATEKDAFFILERCKQLMSIENKAIELHFFSDQAKLMDDGSLLSSPSDIYGNFNGATGTYQKNEGKTTIHLERAQLKQPEQMIATIAHELAHEKLLGENNIYENDEYLTDLTAIVFGFGLFIGNARFNFESGTNNGFGWKMSSQGYLPEQIIGYAMASLSLKKQETSLGYLNHLNSSVKNYFMQSLQILNGAMQIHDIKSFWPIEQQKQITHQLDSEDKRTAEQVKEYDKEELVQLQKELIAACYQGNIASAETILSQQISPNFNGIGGSPFSIAVKRNDFEMIDCLLDYGADVNFSELGSLFDNTPLMAACATGNIDMVYQLIQLGAEVNKVGGNGKSPLQIAVEANSKQLVSYLLEVGANIEIKSGAGFTYTKTPICFAVTSNHKDMVSFLVEKGAKIKPIRKLPRQEISATMVKFLKTKKYL